jgi:uncharacterized membrane protein
VPTIERSILISASPTEVFSLIADIEAIPSFSASISEVTRISDNNYAWKAEVSGISFEWNSAIIQKEEPRYLSWQSITGFENRGEYVLEPQDGKTKLIFFMRYQLPSRIIEKALHTIIDKLIDEMYAEILANIKKEIEEKNGLSLEGGR